MYCHSFDVCDRCDTYWRKRLAYLQTPSIIDSSMHLPAIMYCGMEKKNGSQDSDTSNTVQNDR